MNQCDERRNQMCLENNVVSGLIVDLAVEGNVPTYEASG